MAVVTTDFKFPDDNSILNAVNATHTPDGRITAIKLLLSVAAKILKKTGITILDQELLEDNITQTEIVKTIEALTPTIPTVFCKLACECSGGDQHGGAMRIFELLGCYDWDAKVMKALTAFAMVAMAKTSLIETLAPFNRLPRIIENIQVLIQAVTKLSKCITDVTCYSDYISDGNLSLVECNCKFSFPIAAYWIIRSLVACSSHFTSLTDEQSDTHYISFLVRGINNLYGHINVLKQKIEEKIYQDSYSQIKILFERRQRTNLLILEGIHNSKDPKPLLIHCKKGKVTLEEVLTKETVKLYVSDLSIAAKTEELSMLKTKYIEMCSVKQRSHQWPEVVWIPIIDNFTDAMKQTFDDLVADMPWYVLDPLCLKREAKQYIKEKWVHKKKTALVVLNQGMVVCPNALHMVRIWKKLDFPIY